MSRCSRDGQPLCFDCKGFCAIPTTEAVGWPANVAHATSPHQALLARFAQKAAEVVALSATGEALSADLTVTEGHRHNTEATLLEWRQLAAWPVIGRALDTLVAAGQVISSSAATEDIGLYLFRMPTDSLGVRLRDVFYPRLRATVPTPGAPAISAITVTGDLIRIGVGGVLTVVSALPPLNLAAKAAPPVSFIDRWFTWGAVEINPAVTDARFGLRLRAQAGGLGQQGTVFEVAVGLRGGL